MYKKIIVLIVFSFSCLPKTYSFLPVDIQKEAIANLFSFLQSFKEAETKEKKEEILYTYKHKKISKIKAFFQIAGALWLAHLPFFIFREYFERKKVRQHLTLRRSATKNAIDFEDTNSLDINWKAIQHLLISMLLYIEKVPKNKRLNYKFPWRLVKMTGLEHIVHMFAFAYALSYISEREKTLQQVKKINAIVAQ